MGVAAPAARTDTPSGPGGSTRRQAPVTGYVNHAVYLPRYPGNRLLPVTDLLVTEAAWGRLPHPWRTSCSGSCSSPSCSGSLSAWIALVVIGCMIKDLGSAVIGIVLFLINGVFGGKG